MNDENIKYIEDLSDFINIINRDCSSSNKREQIFYRGQNKDFSNNLPSLIRNEHYLDNEDKLINDFITQYPKLFNDCNNNFDRLALMQHHQLPTRLLDLTSNPLVALYFAVERNNEGNNDDSDEKDGKVFPFTNFYNTIQLRKALNDFHLGNLIDDFYSIKGNNRQYLKSPFSDEIEIESSLARLNGDDRNNVLNNLIDFYQQINSVSMSGKQESNLSWSDLYISKILNHAPQSIEDDILDSYEFFNKDASVQRLYHEIRTDIGDFQEQINPLDLFIPKIVKPRIIDQRISNQNGLFMFVPFIGDFVSGSDLSLCQINFNQIKEYSQNRIDILRFLYTNNKPLTFIIPKDKKALIRSELRNVGITESFIYPDPSHVAYEISKKY